MFRPDAIDLIDIARQTLVDRVLPAQAGENRYEGLMIANALGIALRELRAAEEMAEVKRGMLETVASLLGEPVLSEKSDLAHCKRRLASAIRAGTFDPGNPGSVMVRELLAIEVRARMAVDNPKALG
jgi:hypothetical protein